MEFDLENPLTSLNDAHSHTIPVLFATESDHMPSRNYLQCLKSCDFSLSFRQQAIALIFQIGQAQQDSCNYDDPFLPYLAVNYMDRFISRQEIPQSKSWLMRLIVISCLSLAAKMKNTQFSISKFPTEDGFIFDARTLNRMELLVLDGLNWRMRSITPFSFIHFFVSSFQVNNPPLTQALKDRATELIFKSHTDIRLLEFKPSIISASAILVAAHELFPLQFPSFKSSISSSGRVNKDKLQKCINVLQEIMEMECLESKVDTMSSSRTPLSVLDRHCSRTRSESITTTTTTITGNQAIKRQRLNC